MEGHEKIKQLSLEEIKKIDPKKIAYMTLVGGEVVVVNGLNHAEYNKKEKEYLAQSLKNQNPKKTITINSSNLQKIQEANEENERNSNQVNNEPLNLMINPSNNKFPDENPNDINPELICPIDSIRNNLKTQPRKNKCPNFAKINKPSIKITDNNINYNRVDQNYHTGNSNNRLKIINFANNQRERKSNNSLINKRYNTSKLISKNNFNGRELSTENYNYKDDYSNFGTFIDPNDHSVVFSVRPRKNIFSSYYSLNQSNPLRVTDITRANTNYSIPNKSYGSRTSKKSSNHSYKGINCCKKKF